METPLQKAANPCPFDYSPSQLARKSEFPPIIRFLLPRGNSIEVILKFSTCRLD
jgi:hypothetical protein